MNIQQMTGLEIMQALVQGLIPPPSISKTMPMDIEFVELNRVIFKATPNHTHANPMGGCMVVLRQRF